MQLKGTHTFQATRQQVWDALMDPAVLMQVLPGGEQLTQDGDDLYTAVMNVRVGPVQGKFDSRIELSEIVEPESYRMKVSGQGAPGFVNGEGALRFEQLDDGTRLSYEGDVQVGGRIAGVGQRLLDSSARSLIRQGLQALDDQLSARAQPAAGPALKATISTATEGQPSPTPPPEPADVAQPAARPSGPSATRLAMNVAADVAQDLAADYVPLDKQEKLFYAALGALGMLLFVVLVRLVQR